MSESSLRRLALACGIELTEEMERQFAAYRELLLDWNSRVNLTAITQPGEIDRKHFLDSLLLTGAYAVPKGASLIDVGTGAGFPGIPLKILRPDLRLTLLDSLEKRCAFLREVSAVLGQDNQVIHGRAEELARSAKHREAYDIAVARAVAALPVLCEYCLSLVRVGGVFLAMKGPGGAAELSAAQAAIDALGGGGGVLKAYALPGDERRTVAVIQKISQTPTKYPRRPDKITKAPL